MAAVLVADVSKRLTMSLTEGYSPDFISLKKLDVFGQFFTLKMTLKTKRCCYVNSPNQTKSFSDKF